MRAREATLAEAAATHGAQLELWRAEANEVAQAAAKWKQRYTSLQAQVRPALREQARVEASWPGTCTHRPCHSALEAWCRRRLPGTIRGCAEVSKVSFLSVIPQLESKDAEAEAANQEVDSLTARLNTSEAERLRLQVW